MMQPADLRTGDDLAAFGRFDVSQDRCVPIKGKIRVGPENPIRARIRGFGHVPGHLQLTLRRPRLRSELFTYV